MFRSPEKTPDIYVLPRRLLAILASSSDSENGGLSPPPAKKQRVSAASCSTVARSEVGPSTEEIPSQSNASLITTMEASGGHSGPMVHNGDVPSRLETNGTSDDRDGFATNGDASTESDEEILGNGFSCESMGPKKQLSRSEQDIVRLIGQHLRGLGFK